MAGEVSPERSTGDTPEEDVFQGESDALLREASSTVSAPLADRRLLFCLLPSLLLCALVIRFDSSYVIGNYARQIAGSLHEFKNSRWLVLGFLVTESSVAPLYGHAAQVYGPRNALLVAATFMLAGLLLSSLSSSLWQIALSRVIVGAGSAGIEILVVIMLNDLVQLYELPLWNSAAVAIGTIGLMFGSPVGAALADLSSFRWTFFFEFLAMAVAMITLYFGPVQSALRQAQSEHGIKKLEWLSALSLLATVATPLFALNLAGEVIAWNDAVIIVLLCLTAPLAALFYYLDSHIATNPIVPKRFIGNPHVAIALGCALPMKFCFDQLRFSFGTYLEARSLDDPSHYTDWALTCIYLGRSVGTIASGVLIRRSRKFKTLLQMNIIVDILIYMFFALGLIHPEKPAFAPVLIFIGGTEGFAEGVWLVALLSLVIPQDQPLLYALFALLMSVSGDIGIAVSLAAESSLVRSRLNANLSGYANAAEIIRKSLEDLRYVRQLPPTVQNIIVQAITSSTEAAFGMSCLVLVISLVCSFYVRDMTAPPTEMPFIS